VVNILIIEKQKSYCCEQQPQISQINKIKNKKILKKLKNKQRSKKI
jgi:hypothetical protein